MRIKLLNKTKLMQLSFEYDYIADSPESIAQELKKDLDFISEVDLMRIKNDIKMIVDNIKSKAKLAGSGDESFQTSQSLRAKSKQQTTPEQVSQPKIEENKFEEENSQQEENPS